MKMRICSKCGHEIEDERPRKSRYCLSCAAQPGRGGDSHVAWCRRWAIQRQLAAKMRSSSLCYAVESAVVVYPFEGRNLGHVVVEWRGTVQPEIKFAHAR